MLGIYAIYFKALFRRFIPSFHFFLAFLIPFFFIGGLILAMLELSPRSLALLLRAMPLVILFSFGIPFFMMLVATLFTLPNHIRFYKMVRYQEDRRGELASSILKDAVPCVAGDDANAFIFTSGDWLVSVGEVAVKRKNYKTHVLTQIDGHVKHFSGMNYHVDVHFVNMPWEKASINPARASVPFVAVNAEVMESIDKWQRS